jgi:hypothetical protein
MIAEVNDPQVPNQPSDVSSIFPVVFPRLGHNWRRRNSYLLLTALTLLCLLPFSGKSFQVDDPLFVWAGKHIAQHPLDPYGFQLVWDTTEVSMFQVTKNPPLSCYYAALIGSMAGWSEVALHLGFLLPTLALVLGTYRLARSFTGLPLAAAAATLLTPGVLCSASSVMCDTFMLALWLWAVIFWIEGFEPVNPRYLMVSGLLIGAAGMTKYFGVALIPLLLTYSVVRRRKVGLWICYFVIPISMFVAYQLWTRALYGEGLLWNAAHFAGGYRATSGQQLLFPNVLMSISFTGGCMLVSLLLAPMVWSWKQIAFGAVPATIAGVAMARGWLRIGTMLQADQVSKSLTQHWGLVAVQLAIFIGSGLSLLAMASADAWKKRNADSLLLLLWVFGTFLFAGFLNWTINVRSVLPLIPAAAILLARQLDEYPSIARERMRLNLVAALAVSGALSLWVTQADAAWADSAHEAAEIIYHKAQNENTNVWFQGHWGFQYYMQLHGAHPIDYARTRLNAGDLVVIPENSIETYKMKPQFIASAELLEIPLHEQMATMRWELGAGFYSTHWGPLPFATGNVPPERYYILRAASIPSGVSPWEDPFTAPAGR